MFGDSVYNQWTQSRLKPVIDQYGYKFFFGLKVLDLGAANGDCGGILYRLGSDVVAIEAKSEHIKILQKKYSGIKAIKANLDGPWPFYGQKFDFTLDLALVCHLANYEKHLKEVCASTNYLILETAVCDSDDPNKCISVPENKDIYDLAFGNTGCRPSPAAIERVLTNCGMTFKRLDQTKFNAGEYVYDWQAKNDNSTSIYKRRIWFCSKSANASIAVEPAKPITFQKANSPIGFTPPQQNNNVSIPLTRSGKPPMSAQLTSRAQERKTAAFAARSNSYYIECDSLPEEVQSHTRISAVFYPEKFVSPTIFQTEGTILPNTISSRLWLSKIVPLFPNLKLTKNAVNMLGFNKGPDNTANVVMCDIDHIMPCERIFIEEWNKELVKDQIDILRHCRQILTPSLLNMESILKNIPTAQVSRIEKVWPVINGSKNSSLDYYLYFEKDPKLTDLLLNSWEERFERLFVVGARFKLPSFVDYISDCINYQTIINLMGGAKTLIDLSDNTYYKSGLLSLANNIALPIISNNRSIINYTNENYILIDQENNKQLDPASINTAITTLFEQNISNNIVFNNAHNLELNKCVAKLLGTNA